MSTAAEKIIEAALQLEPVERERIAETLWQSLEDPATTSAAWSQEIQRRVVAADANPSDSASWEDTRDELLAELRQIHPRGR